MNYYRRFPGDYARDTKHLSMLEHAAYCLLLDTLYSTEKPLPKELPILYRICGAFSKSERKAVENVLVEFFSEKPTGFTNKRFEEEVKHAESRIKAAKENGRLGGRPPKQEPRRNPEHNPEKSSPDSRLQINTNSNTEREEPSLVDWIPINLWRDYLSMRERLKHPLTPAGIDIQIGKLRVLRDAGEDVVLVLEQAISGSWFDFRPIRKENGHGSAESFAEKRSRTSAAAIQKIFGGDEKLARPVRRALPPTC